MFLVILLWWYKRYNICLILFFNLYEVLPAFTWANNNESLVNNLYGVKIFNPVPVFFLFGGFNFTLSAKVSSGSDFTSSSPSSAGSDGKSSSSSSKYKSIGKISGISWTFIFFFLAFVNLSFWVSYIFRSLFYNSRALSSTISLFSRSFILSSLFGLRSIVS